uniref:Epidermal growth factor receptor pathway substrate 15 n=1 Tax=Knipowitschia caucasica TaxID=637954 RepID=A0AAV2KXW3_KNICA
MRERLTTTKYSNREDLLPVKEKQDKSEFDVTARVPIHRQLSSPVSPNVQWTDLAAIQSQLQMQGQAIESLTKRLHNVEREKQSQQCLIQSLQAEVQRLHEDLRERGEWQEQGPGAERRMEQWRREVGRELSSLRGHVTRTTSLEESFSSKLRREELDFLRKEVEQLKTRLRRQEESVFLQQTEARESRRQYEHSCKTLEELTDSYRIHSTDLANTASRYSHTQQEVHQIRATVSDLKDEVRSLVLRDHEPTSLLSVHSTGSPLLQIPQIQNTTKARVDRPPADSDSEDFSPTPSLTEISSDDLSWLEDLDPALQQKPRVRLSIKSRRSDLDVLGSDLDDDDDADGGGDKNEEDGGDFDVPDYGSDLSLDDL